MIDIDEELEAIKLSPCRMCEGKASVRRVSNDWWYVGCECPTKYTCTREFVPECVEKWQRRNGK